MRKIYSLLLLGGLLFFGVQNARAEYNICWTAANINGSWYYCRSSMDWCTSGAFNNANLGTLESLTLGGQAQWWDGSQWGDGSTMIMGYKIDGGESQSITLTKYDYKNDNNFFQSGGSSYAGTSIDISGLAAGEHTIAVWYKITKDATDYYDSNSSNNYVAKFYIASSTVTLNSVNAAADGYATFCSASNFTFSGTNVKAYKAALNGTGTALTLTEVTGKIPANAGIIFIGPKAGTVTITYTADDATATMTGNELKGNAYRKLRSDIQTLTNFYAFNKTTNNFEKYTGEYLPANKAYYENGSAIGAAPSLFMEIEEENGATNIEAIAATEDAVKFFQNGKLFIKKNGVVYDMMGAIVK